jgi:hypothetical protein
MQSEIDDTVVKQEPVLPAKERLSRAVTIARGRICDGVRVRFGALQTARRVGRERIEVVIARLEEIPPRALDGARDVVARADQAIEERLALAEDRVTRWLGPSAAITADGP